ncbi:glycoside hydrolase family 88/105 protein [Paenibacillus abyssi]|uniref:Glycoside hydrolase n=1 Tax=Paenibacillus abyssi TaxID=1340531 RepID=A0A917CRB7_9BACL|nr:glycoside hydrolase family 88 protein [Paenibacillus abyssi]GGF95276.1 hypothetical protein GCM10010916_10800 [Paenibacillus abyssi]
MSYIHPPSHSSYAVYQGNIEETLRLIADRYIGSHPKHPFVYRASSLNGFKRSGDYRYELNMDVKLPGLRLGQFVYAWAKCWCEQESEWAFSVSCFGPTRLHVNGRQAFKSNIQEDVFPDRRSWFRIKLQQGWNHFVLQFEKTGTGCGACFGTGSIKGLPLHFIVPSTEREGQEGWIFTEGLDQELVELPGPDMSEADTGLEWLPNRAWTDNERAAGVFARLFGNQKGKSAWAWTKLTSAFPGERLIELEGDHQGPITICLDGMPVYESPETSGRFRISLPVTFGNHDLLVRSVCADESWGISFQPPAAGFQLKSPHEVLGSDDQWLYLGVFEPGDEPDLHDIPAMDTLFKTAEGEGGRYWRVDQPNTVVRPFAEATNFGRWNYPLGVTLYGLLKTGRELGRSDYVDYALSHIEQCTAYDGYALWDKAAYGAAGVNHQLSAIDSLDDCGSFAATMLYAMEQRELEGGRAVADRIAEYISHEQDRLEDGALYRVHGSTDFMQQTMWCDDLYMSTPFLSRYYKLTGNPAYVDDAALQFLLYKNYLFMPQEKIMSHVYDFKFNKPTSVPWGRGNGWVLFSLTELLAVLPEDHHRRSELMSFFNELCEGYLKLQGENGLWHQVLNVPESYEETSCTSMFLYAYARGLRYGWLKDQDPYIQAVLKGWEGLAKVSIDRSGNIYGVCRGSGYAFSPLYYKDELTWNLNDTHGIGIVMLAGIEVLKLQRKLQAGGKTAGLVEKQH